jgi:nitrous oxide reductase
MTRSESGGAISRRTFLQQAALAISSVGLGSLLSACGSAPQAGQTQPTTSALANAETVASPVVQNGAGAATLAYWY